MKQRNFPWAIIAAAAVAGAGFAGVANYVRHENPKIGTVSSSDDGSTGGFVGKDALSGNNDPGASRIEAANNDPQVNRVSKVDSLNIAIKAKTFNQKGIRVLDVTVENGNAIVDMNNSVRYNWGSEEEAEFINMMKDVLGKFETVKTFQIRVDGEILKSLSHFEVDPPVKVR